MLKCRSYSDCSKNCPVCFFLELNHGNECKIAWENFQGCFFWLFIGDLRLFLVIYVCNSRFGCARLPDDHKQIGLLYQLNFWLAFRLPRHNFAFTHFIFCVHTLALNILRYWHIVYYTAPLLISHLSSIYSCGMIGICFNNVEQLVLHTTAAADSSLFQMRFFFGDRG